MDGGEASLPVMDYPDDAAHIGVADLIQQQAVGIAGIIGDSGADKSDSASGLRQVVGGHQLVKLYDNPWFKARVVADPKPPPVHIVSLLEEQEALLCERLHRHAGRIRHIQAAAEKILAANHKIAQSR